jgi:hypothetical protein
MPALASSSLRRGEEEASIRVGGGTPNEHNKPAATRDARI